MGKRRNRDSWENNNRLDFMNSPIRLPIGENQKLKAIKRIQKILWIVLIVFANILFTMLMKEMF